MNGYAPDTTAIYTRKYLDIQGDFFLASDQIMDSICCILFTKIKFTKTLPFSRYCIRGLDFNGQGTNAGLTKVKK